MAVLWILAGWLVLFFIGTACAARAADRPVWLFTGATGRARLAATGFRLAFTLALAGPLIWSAIPALAAADPLARNGLTAVGVTVAGAGAAIALAAQVGMGASWRVGISENAAGALVTTGLFRVSRNPAFLGQAFLLTGVAIALPCLPTILAPLVFLASASLQIQDEERLLRATHGAAYADWARRMPRWLLF